MLAMVAVAISVLPGALTVQIEADAAGTSANPSTAFLIMDGRRVAVLPGAIEVAASDGKHHLVVVMRNGLAFKADLTVAGGSLSVENVGQEHCDALGADWVLSPQKGGTTIVVKVKKIGDWDCNTSPAMGVLDKKGKVKLVSEPAGATAYYPKDRVAEFLELATPATLVIDYSVGWDTTVVFKKVGYFDCTTKLQFAGGAQPTLSVDSGPATPMTLDEAAAPTVRCALKPIPKLATTPSRK